jgi:tetratricopeptide (TPR) repeat protein
MTEPQTTQPVSEIESATAVPPPQPPAEGEAGPPPPEPEPWTPERVSEWNAYYDRYVMGAVLLLALVVSCNYLSDPAVFLHLRAGELIGQRMAPVTTDEFSYTEAGQPWVNVPWLFQWSQAALYNLVYGAVPVDPLDQTASRGKADRIAIGALGLLDALVRVAAAWALMKIRHRGPGLWWSAICVMLAVGVFYDPLSGIAPGGLASVPGIGGTASAITPAAWSHLFLALELLFLFRALGQGRPGWLWGLVPLFVLWANWDTSFLTGLLVLAAVAVGHWLDGGALAWSEGSTEADELEGRVGDADAKADSARKGVAVTGWTVPPSRALLVLGLCALACLANPWTYRAYVIAATPFIRWFRPGANIQLADTLSFFSSTIRQQLAGVSYVWTLLVAFYLITLALGLGSFSINAARFSWRRFLPFALVSILWGCLIRYSAEFALVFAAVLALNGQEWYQARFGSRGRLGTRWTLWSTGGRVVTLVVIFAMVGLVMTGRSIYKDGIHFGLGYNPDHFPVDAAEFLERQNDIRGNVLNTSMEQGDLLLWKAYPKRKTFIDHRTYLFPRDLLERWDQIRKAIRDDNVEVWKPLLDEYKISTVMIDPAESRLTYLKLKDSPNWIPFYDDGRIVMFGRTDAPAEDRAVFEAHRLDPAKVYRVTNLLPASEGPPTPTSWIDDIFQNRLLDRTQRRTDAAWRWLMMGPDGGGARGFPEPARCLLAIQDARIALSRNPNDPTAYRVLNEAYRMLTLQETALLAGISLTPENQARISVLAPSPDRLLNRFRQRVTALNYAIQTSPTPTTGPARNELFGLNMQLFELYAAVNFRDLARDRLGAALALNPTEDHLPKESRIAIQDQFDRLDDIVKGIDRQMEDYSLEQQPRALDLAMFARQRGAIGMAIKRLEDAETSGDSTALVRPQLLDLYCSTGQPDKAMDLISGSIGDPNLGTEPGTATFRQGLVYYLMGNYLSTATLWGEQSIPRLRMDRSTRALGAAKNLVNGQAGLASNQFLSIPGNLEQQATWEFDLAVCELEGGRPEESAKHFTNALTLEPDLTTRPIAEYYLEKLGKPVPPKREGSRAAKPPASGAKPSTAEPISIKPTVPVPTTPTGREQPAPGGDNAKAATPGEPKKAEERKEGPK